jgi:hypothetical protein
MEFIIGFILMATRNDSIFVVGETMTKSAHFIPICTSYQVPEIERVFVSEIVILDGVPRKIISD